MSLRVLPQSHERSRFVLILCCFALLSGFFGMLLSSRFPELTPHTAAAELSSVGSRAHRATLPKDTPAFYSAVEERRALLTRKIHVTLLSDADQSEVASFDVVLAEHPLWVVFQSVGDGTVRAVINEERIRQFLVNTPPFTIPESRSCSVISTAVDTYGVERSETSCIAQDGFRYDSQQLIRAIRTALENRSDTLEFTASFIPGVLTLTRDGQDIELTRLSTGRSTFKGSGAGRKANVRKALNQHVHNVLVPAGAEYSFSDVIGPPVTRGNGWHEALTIFEGANLRPAPGGGMCQASTTVFRAALRAGLPITEQKNHSLYVVYYEQYGVGLDATVFPGAQDFAFVNDTGAPLLIQAYNDNEEAYVHFYGVDDGRTVTVAGPYFTSNAPAGAKVRGNEILWNRFVKRADGSDIADTFLARYKSIPKSLAKNHQSVAEVTRGTIGPLHAAATSQEE